MRNVLIDAGPLIALFAVDDVHHARYDQWVSEASPGTLRLVTTWPCVVEAAYLLRAKLRFEMLDWRPPKRHWISDIPLKIAGSLGILEPPDKSDLDTFPSPDWQPPKLRWRFWK